MTADLSGDNFIQVRNGVADGIVTFGIEDIKPAKGWEIEAAVTIDTVNDEITGQGFVTFPFQLKRRQGAMRAWFGWCAHRRTELTGVFCFKF